MSHGGCGYDPAYYEFSGSANKWGWVVGVGLERAISANWTAKIEALYVDLGENDVGGNCYYCTYYGPEPTHNSIYIARVGLNYKFWGGNY
jgi:outer membrane immunogenic protein